MKGLYRITNPDKYLGDVNKITYRSSWEFKFMRWLDKNPKILKWSSEPFPITYISPVDKKTHKYWPDFFIIKDRDGAEERVLIEIKPKIQSFKPIKGKKQKRTFIKENIRYAINQAKWNAATTFCFNKGWKFQVLNEEHLGIK